MNKFKSEQECFWHGSFGNEYSLRVRGKEIFASYVSLHSEILRKTSNINTIIEFGSNIGLNLDAYKVLKPSSHLSAVEINPEAINELENNKNVNKVYPQSILDFKVDYKRDLVLIKTVLIHINPELLNKVYDVLYKASNKYICIAEYYSPYPDEVVYRGHKDKLFKRDFAGEMLDKYQDLNLVDYGFFYHRDNTFPLGDVNWFLLRKNN